jgi:hypothetical protein
MAAGFDRDPANKVEDAAHVAGDEGKFVLGVRDDVLSGVTPAEGDYTGLLVDQTGALHVVEKCATATVTSVNDSATSVTLLAANTARKGASIWNHSDATLYVKFGGAASLTDFSVILITNSYFELGQPMYPGIVCGIWDANSTGAARITEYS